jgi:hypothetical protein
VEEAKVRFLSLAGWLLVAGSFSSQTSSIAQDMKALVLDASDGKPEPNVDVEYFCVGLPQNSEHARAITNKEGFAAISNFCNDSQDIEISVYPRNKKEQCGVGVITLKKILSLGAISQPNSAGGIWCSTKVSKTLKPVPGQVIMFVKKPTWWQSHVAG